MQRQQDEIKSSPVVKNVLKAPPPDHVLELITNGSKLQLLCTYLNKTNPCKKKKKKTPLAHTGSKMDHLTNDRRMRRSRSNRKSSNSTSSNNSCLCRTSRSFKAESTDEAVQLPSPGKWWPQLLLDKKKFLLVRMFFFVFFLLFLLLLLVASCRCEE
jgi:hypothetical protein